MKRFTTSLNVIPVRAEPTHRSEQVTQALFGEQLFSLTEQDDFLYMQMLESGYEGWVQRAQVFEIAEGTAEHYTDIVGLSPVYANDGAQAIRLYHGTPVYNRHIEIGNGYFKIEGETRQPTLGDFVSEFPKLLEHYLRTPYFWGGRTSAGIDCSGFSQAFLGHFGIRLRRDAYQQAESGELVNFLSEVKAGDLAFFDNEAGKVTHVGVMIDQETIVHASGEVRMDKLDHQGIYHKQHQKHTHQLRIIKRYF